MFSPKGLFKETLCPDANTDEPCSRNPCPFNHSPAVAAPTSSVTATGQSSASRKYEPPHFPPPVRKYSPAESPASVLPVKSSSPLRTTNVTARNGDDDGWTVVSRKRPLPDSNDSGLLYSEPPSKVQRVEGSDPRKAVSSPYVDGSGGPILRINASQSKIPLKDRQKMLTLLYLQFQTLYVDILSTNPGLASEHALAQELDVYNRTNKATYRNAMITAAASIKKRPPPTSITHPSVGTDASIAERVAQLSSLSSFHLLSKHLTSLLLKTDQMESYGYLLKVSEEKGGEKPNAVGTEIKCERCSQKVILVSPSTVAEMDKCQYHWGRPYTNNSQGIKEKIYRCCNLVYPSPGCEIGVHVFYESDVNDLHSRYPFASSSSDSTTALDVAAIDCEMLYSTAGLSLARVSVVDGKGDQVFDELVRMNEDVEILDMNTRFSGITSLAEAVFDLPHVRQALSSYIGPDTILIGHALENDLKALRMVHTKVVDTAVLFPHKLGAPYRRALRDLAREYLGQFIQNGGGTTGHSSVEDARATLDLVRWWVMDKEKKKDSKL